jgi:tetratricopeptide (TPR) repeat protein
VTRTPIATPLRLITVLLLALCVGAAFAAEKKKSADGQREAPQLGAAVGKQINDAIELLNAKNPAGAKAAIGKLKLENLSPFERSRVEQILASIDNDSENFSGAAKHLAAALEAGGLSADEGLQVKFQIAQLYLAQEKWKDGAAALEEWFKVAPSPNASAYYMLAMAYYQQNDYSHALAPAEKAVQASDKPQPNWVQLLLALYLHLEKWDKAVPLVTYQVRAAPQDKAGWQQLASIYSQQQLHDRALVVTELMDHAGMLSTPEETLRVAEQMLYGKMPYRAASYLSQAVEQNRLKGDAAIYQKIANAWLAAREYGKAVPPMQRAFDLSGDANIGARISDIHLQRNDWPAAEAAAQKALAKGGLKNPGSVRLNLGIALYNQNKLDEARAAFEQAAQAGERQYARAYLQAIATRQGKS